MVSSILPKNKRKQFDLRYHNSNIEFFVPFWRELKIPKRHFEINWPLVISKFLHILFCKFSAFSLEFKKLSWSLEQFFLTVGQNNFGNKIPWKPFRALEYKTIISCYWMIFFSIPNQCASNNCPVTIIKSISIFSHFRVCTG